MELNRAQLQPALEDEPLPANLGRKAGFITLLGCISTILGALVPGFERVAFGISLTTLGIQADVVALVILAVISAAIAGVVLLRRPAPPAIAIALLILAAAQLGLAAMNALNILHAIDRIYSHQILIGYIGTGAYACVLGSVGTLAAAILAWTKRASGLVPPTVGPWAPGDDQPS